MAILVFVQILQVKRWGVALPELYMLGNFETNALQGCIPCAILMKFLGFVGISMSSSNSYLGRLCLTVLIL